MKAIIHEILAVGVLLGLAAWTLACDDSSDGSTDTDTIIEEHDTDGLCYFSCEGSMTALFRCDDMADAQACEQAASAKCQSLSLSLSNLDFELGEDCRMCDDCAPSWWETL